MRRSTSAKHVAIALAVKRPAKEMSTLEPWSPPMALSRCALRCEASNHRCAAVEQDREREESGEARADCLGTRAGSRAEHSFFLGKKKEERKSNPASKKLG